MSIRPPYFRDSLQNVDNPAGDRAACPAFPSACDACEIISTTSDTIGSPISVAWTAERPGDVYELVIRRVDVKDDAGLCLTTVDTKSTEIPLAPGHYSVSVRSVRRRRGSWNDSADLGTYGSRNIAEHFTVSAAMRMLGPFDASDMAPPLFYWYPVVGAVRYDILLVSLIDGCRMRLTTDGHDSQGLGGLHRLPPGPYQLSAVAIDRLGNSTPRTHVSFDCRQSALRRPGVRRTLRHIFNGLHTQ